ncbi:MAG: haloacid dehalogenase type II [Chlorobiaceae bacterium]|nr:haloacid dehalogenase type II [Chlorobiaceae bacterium]NTW10150.1 haloacid dehalogenase type II [Chlorobiaceae bacterium]
MQKTIAFDIYGTIIDTQGITGMLEKHAGFKAGAFSQLWRQKVLEYSFRRGLMRMYRDFGVCTAQALDYTILVFGISLSNAEKNELLDAYRELPVFDDVEAGLEEAKNAGFGIYAFSNGKAADVAHLLDHAGIGGYFIDIVSVDELGTFKPDPEVYRHFLLRTSSERENTWLVSSNPFDVLGAAAAGMKSAWVRRSSAVIMDPWEIAPDLTVEKLDGIVRAIEAHKSGQAS